MYFISSSSSFLSLLPPLPLPSPAPSSFSLFQPIFFQSCQHFVHFDNQQRGVKSNLLRQRNKRPKLIKCFVLNRARNETGAFGSDCTSGPACVSYLTKNKLFCLKQISRLFLASGRRAYN